MSSAYGIKAIKPTDAEHVLGFASARGTADDALFEVWNGSTSSTRVLRLDKAGQLQAQSGTVARPSYSFEDDKDAGVYWVSSEIRTAIAGADVLAVAAAGVTVTGNLTVSGAINASTSGVVLGDNEEIFFGTGTDYWFVYSSSGTQFEFRATDIDGSGTDGIVWAVDDGTDDVVFTGNTTAVTVTGSTSVVAGTLTAAAGSITDSSGAITFGNENLVTTGTFGSGAATVAALIATTGVFSGILKTDNTTDATSGTDGSLQTDGGLSVAKAIYVGTTAKIIGVTTHGGNVVSDTDSTDDLGTTGVRWANLWVDAITMGGALTASGGGALTGTWSNLGVVTTVDINGGTVGGVTLDGTISGTPTWASNQAITLSTAAQANVTSLGTLTVLQVDNLNVNLNTISATTGAINITPATGSAILLDGTISVDAGVVTGATSITSTAFVGALTGNASGSSGSTTGNAATATALQTARTIGGTSFDGTANIAVALSATATALATARAINGVNFDGTAAITVTAAAGTLTGTTLKSTVVTSSLTAVGTIGTGVWNGTKVASAYLDDDTAHLSGTQTFTGAKTFSAALVASSTLAVTGTSALTGSVGIGAANLSAISSVGRVLSITSGSGGEIIIQRDDSLIADGNIVGGLAFFSNDTQNQTEYSGIQARASGTAGFMDLNFYGKSGSYGSNTPDMTIDTNGAISMAGSLSVDDTTQTSSGTTGSIHTDGGLGVAKDLFVSGNISLAATSGVYFDGGAHTLIKENSPNVLRCVAGGSGGVDLTNGATSWTSVSDERAKNLGEPIIDAMAKLGTLRTMFGTFKDDHQEIRHPFLIAQDVLAVYPEAVVMPEEEDLYRLSYTDMIPLMISGMNETGGRVETIEQKVERLTARIDELEATA